MVLCFSFDINPPEDSTKTKWEDTNISLGWAGQEIFSAAWNLPSTPVRRLRLLNAECRVSVPPHRSLAAQVSVPWTLSLCFPLWVARSFLKLSMNQGTGFRFAAHRVKMHLSTKEMEPDSALVATLLESCSPLPFNLFLLFCTKVKGVRIRPQIWFHLFLLYYDNWFFLFLFFHRREWLLSSSFSFFVFTLNMEEYGSLPVYK